MNQELIIIATAAAPLAEVDAAIPLALSFGFTPAKAYLLSVLGNYLPLLPLLWFWPVASRIVAARWKWFDKILQLVFHYTRNRYGKRIEKTGLAAIVLLLALPIPFAGAWTMTVLAFLYGFPVKRSLGATILGVTLGAVVVLGISMSAFKIIQ